MNYKIISILAIAILLSTVAYGCSDNSASVLSSPEQVIQDYYQSINDHDCEKNINLRSSSDQLVAGKSHDDSVKACQQLIYDGAPVVTVTNVSVSSNDGKIAEVKFQAAFNGVNYQKILDVDDILVMEEGGWKVYKSHSTPHNNSQEPQ